MMISKHLEITEELYDIIQLEIELEEDIENGSYHPNEKTVIECNDKMIN